MPTLPQLAAAILITAMPSAPRAAEPETVIAMLPIRLLDTSGEPRDQSAEHAARLTAMAAALSADLGQGGRYRVVAVEADTLATACPEPDPACIVRTARERGAALAFVGVVHKSSTLIMQLFARVVETRSGNTVFARELNFRGDNDEAWARAEAFLVGQIATDPPKPQP